MTKRKTKNLISDKKLQNSLTDFATGLGFSHNFASQLSQVATIIKNNKNYFLSNDRNTLSWCYINYGVIQTLIDQPIEDAFKGGIEINSEELDDEDVKKIFDYCSSERVFETIKQTLKWADLFGGAGLVINAGDDNDSKKPLDLNKINPKSNLEFYAADRWELNKANLSTFAEDKPYIDGQDRDAPYSFYGVPLHKSRVIDINGKEAPSFARSQLRGWGMSKVEHLVRSINQALKNQNVAFELIDEAKIDIYKIYGFTEAMGSDTGKENAHKRIALANQIKNHQNALIMDKEDGYEQKQINFAGMSEINKEIRTSVAADMRMPISKIYGQSITGMNAGEDDIENYNSMIESSIRGRADALIIQVIKIISKKVHDFIPEDIGIKYKPLRVLSAEQEENVKNHKLNRLLQLYDRGVITSSQLVSQINLGNLTVNNLEDLELEDFPVPPPEKPDLDLQT